jgi:elongation factor G
MPFHLQLPIGAEDSFTGVVDLINFRGMVWNEADKGMTYKVIPIPDDMMEEATQIPRKIVGSCF